MTRLSIVIIGRNEGTRLIRCLESLPKDVPAVYVDSGSTDDSLSEAKNRGLVTVSLDFSRPFSAARARNAGVAALQNAGIASDYIQFLDGDCTFENGWLKAGLDTLDNDSTIALVTGWRREINPDASIYNAISQVEWHRPAGDILACSGDLMVRRKVFDSVGQFNPDVIAAEDDEFCVRIGKAGWRLVRLPQAMSVHDANMFHFSEWWRRAVRSGHGFAQVGHLHEDYFRRERLRVAIYGAVLPTLAIFFWFTFPWLICLILAAYLWSFAKSTLGLLREGLQPKSAARQAVFLVISKFPNIIGMARFYIRHLMRRNINIIEYK